MKMKFYIFLLLIFLNVRLLGQNNSESIIFNKKISGLLQSGIEKAMNNEISKSYAYFEEAYQLASTRKYDQLIPVIVLSQSRLYLIEDKYNEAFECIKKAEKLIESNPNSSLAGDYYEFLGQCYTHKMEYELAIVNLQKSESIRKLIEPSKNWRTYNGLSKIYKQLKNDSLREYYSEQSSMLSKIQNSKRIILDMQNDLKFDEQTGTIAYLNHENLKSKVELQKARFNNLLLLICLTTFIIISVFLFYILKLRNKHNSEIALKNEIISKSLQEKEMLMKEIHHRVKNNLQVISSLLSLQSRSVDDKEAFEALIQSQSRVISMSLIHETLYKDGPASNIDLKEYLTKLSQQVFNTYNIDGDKIDLHIDVCNVNIDVGKLVPIGLIINELINNSLKYAFVGQDKGKIWVLARLDEERLTISVKDNGIGYDQSKSEMGFGNKLIDTFAKKLNAIVTKNFDLGTQVSLIFNLMNNVND